LKTRGGYRLT
jgi:hypothetical protein